MRVLLHFSALSRIPGAVRFRNILRFSFASGLNELAAAGKLRGGDPQHPTERTCEMRRIRETGRVRDSDDSEKTNPRPARSWSLSDSTLIPTLLD
jgi:hypothetical protein